MDLAEEAKLRRVGVDAEDCVVSSFVFAVSLARRLPHLPMDGARLAVTQAICINDH